MSKIPYLAILAAAATGPAYGLGIEFTYHDPEVLARGNAGVASNTNASAVYYFLARARDRKFCSRVMSSITRWTIPARADTPT